MRRGYHKLSIQNQIRGRVIRKELGRFHVHSNEGILVCPPTARLQREAEGDFLAVGDEVRIEPSGPRDWAIAEVFPRRNQIGRRSVHKRAEQVIAANLDQVITVFAAAFPAPKWGLLDRYLAECESSSLPVLVCISKADLAEDGLMDENLAEYSRLGYPVIRTSAESGEGIAEFRNSLRGRVSVLVGKSGVGKTSLMNALEPGLGLRTKEVGGATGKGKHTTTHLQMHPLACGGAVIDTPGMREFGLVVEEPMDWLFREFRPFLSSCRFGSDCAHDREPGCAVKAAVEKGEVSLRRYESYLKLR